jgi:CheY-like chemotaxis protein
MPRILIVDDRPSNRELLRATLEYAGHQVAEAPDGPAALEHLHQHPIDLVIMDIQMPGLDGYHVLALIRQVPHLATIPVIALTAYAMDGDAERGVQAGFNAYVTKPVALRHLLRIINESLPA